MIFWGKNGKLKLWEIGGKVGCRSLAERGVLEIRCLILYRTGGSNPSPTARCLTSNQIKFMKLPKKAIIVVAGTGTRFLPATKAVPKEMLPIIDKPIVQYSVEEVVASGVKDVIIVHREGAKAVRKHFTGNKPLEKQLKETGKKKRLKMIKDIDRMAKFSFAVQTPKMPYGTAMPLRIVADKVKDGPFFYLFGDDMILSDVPACKQLMEVYRKNPDVLAVIAVQRIPRKYAYRYGMVKLKPGTKNEYENIIEKPKPGKEPSDLAEFGRFLFSPKIVPIVKKLKVAANNELEIVDAINELTRQGRVLVCEIKGKWLTTGDPLNYLKAMVELTWQRQDLKNDFKKYIVEKIKK